MRCAMKPNDASPAPSGTDKSAAIADSEANHGPRSNYGELPGAEFPKAVYRSVIGAFGFILLASWVAFGGGTDAKLSLDFATVLTIVFFALPIILYKTAAAR